MDGRVLVEKEYCMQSDAHDEAIVVVVDASELRLGGAVGRGSTRKKLSTC